MTNTYNSKVKDWLYYDKTIQICKKWGIPYIDLNIECPPLGYILSLKEQYTYNSDGWHPNEEGYKKYYCDKIEAWMKTL
jgi:lysophospholipase L1-like esterase